MSELLAPFAPLAILPNGEAVRPDEVSRVLIEAVPSLVEEAGERFWVAVHLTDGISSRGGHRPVAGRRRRPRAPLCPRHQRSGPAGSDDVAAAAASAAGSAAGSSHRALQSRRRRESRHSRPARRPNPRSPQPASPAAPPADRAAEAPARLRPASWRRPHRQRAEAAVRPVVAVTVLGLDGESLENGGGADRAAMRRARTCRPSASPTRTISARSAAAA